MIKFLSGHSNPTASEVEYHILTENVSQVILQVKDLNIEENQLWHWQVR
jgi:hypothetical protein